MIEDLRIFLCGFLTGTAIAASLLIACTLGQVGAFG